MATSPPITIGELPDVPAPNSPVNAQFHQEVANRIVHRFATVAAMNAWAAGNGSVAYSADTGKHYLRRGGAWVPIVFEGSPGSVPTVALVDGAVTSAKIADGTIVAADLHPSVLAGDLLGLTAANAPGWTSPRGWLKRIGTSVWFHMDATKNGGTGVVYQNIPIGWGSVYVWDQAGICLTNGSGWGVRMAVDGHSIDSINSIASVPDGYRFTFDLHWICNPNEGAP